MSLHSILWWHLQEPKGATVIPELESRLVHGFQARRGLRVPGACMWMPSIMPGLGSSNLQTGLVPSPLPLYHRPLYLTLDTLPQPLFVGIVFIFAC